MNNPATNLAVREVTPDDAPRVAALLSQLGYPASADEVTQRLTYWQPDPMSLVLVAERNGQVVGCLSMHAIPYLERTGWWARVESLVVDESVRGTGTGSALLAAAELTARQWGCLAVEITSLRTRDDAQAFYPRMGYSDVCGKSARFQKALVPNASAAP
jgi:GNAT superfamily N-acetyltransferase